MKFTSSKPERKFALYWRALDGPKLVQEHKFCDRRWRFDFAHLSSRTAIEIEGGVWRVGRHQRPQGFLNDLEKYFAAQAHGWIVWRLAPDMITSEHLHVIIGNIKERTL